MRGWHADRVTRSGWSAGCLPVAAVCQLFALLGAWGSKRRRRGVTTRRSLRAFRRVREQTPATRCEVDASQRLRPSSRGTVCRGAGSFERE